MYNVMQPSEEQSSNEEFSVARRTAERVARSQNNSMDNYLYDGPTLEMKWYTSFMVNCVCLFIGLVIAVGCLFFLSRLP